MLIDFFFGLRKFKIPVSTGELLDLLAALKQGIVFADIQDFYIISRLILIKDTKYYDRFDQAFSAYFEGLEDLDWSEFEKSIPKDWLEQALKNELSEARKKNALEFDSLDKLLEELKERMQSQEKRHQGGNHWIGTGGTSPFGAFGYNPSGVRVGGESKHKKAAKVWEQRRYANLDNGAKIGVRNIEVALKRLRAFARKGAAEELDLDDTIRSTAQNAGWLDIKMVPERHNSVKVLLFFDVGGSMDAHVRVCEQLFTAASSAFKSLKFFYFHNCIYEGVWRDNYRRSRETESTLDILNRYGPDYKVIIVGDAAMGPYEIDSVGGSVEHFNSEPGGIWLQRIKAHWRRVAWLNPEPKGSWDYVPTTTWIKQCFEDQMFELTLEGFDSAMRYLAS